MSNVNVLLDQYDRWKTALDDVETRRNDPEADFDLDEVGELQDEAKVLLADLVAAVRAAKSS